MHYEPIFVGQIITFKIRRATAYKRAAVGRGIATQSGHTKDHHKNGANCLAAWHAGVRRGV